MYGFSPDNRRSDSYARPVNSSLARDGFVVLPRLLRGTEVASMRATVPALRANRAVGSCERPNNTLVPLRWNDGAVMTALTDAERIVRVTRAATGHDLRWTSGYLSLKDPRSGPLWWHQDWWCWDHPVSWWPTAPQVALICSLDDTSSTRGALRVLPGSHRTSTDLHAELPEGHREPDLPAGHRVLCDHAEQVTITTQVGDAVLLDYRLLHGTHPNADQARRECLILNFAPSWRDLPDDVRAHLIRGPGLPTTDERTSARRLAGLLPTYDGTPRDLPLTRDAPTTFSTASR